MLKHKSNRKGFTLVEVALFLAVTGMLFIGIAVGVQNSIYQQRFSDSVQNFTEFLRTVYSSVMNVENELYRGNSGEAIYGKLVMFGEEKDLEGEPNTSKKIFVYTVIGKAEGVIGGKVRNQLSNAEIHIKDDKGNYFGIVDEYKPRWSAQIKNTDNEDFKGSLLIVRNPGSGAVYTYFNKDLVQDNLAEMDVLRNFLNKDDVDFCISPEGVKDLNVSRDVRIVAKARNASGVEIISDDTTGKEGDKCKSES